MVFTNSLSGRRAAGALAFTAAAVVLVSGWAASSSPGPAPSESTVPPAYMADVQSWVTTGAENDRTYQISVALPEGYDETGDPYPVIFVTDANAEFGMAVETARLAALSGSVPSAVIVGIGYPNPGQGFTASGVPRTLDLTPTSIAGGNPSGGAPEFLAFLRDELVPQIEADFHVDHEDRALMGHSFGGLFAAYALLHNEGLFSRFVIGSPSLWWDDRVILAMEADYAASHDAMPARVFFSVGSVEEETSGFPMMSDMQNFVQILSDRSYGGLELGSHVFDGEDHLSVVPSGFNRGLRFVYADAEKPTVTVKPESVGEDGTYSSVSFALFDSGKIDRIVLNGVEKDLADDVYSDLNGVVPGMFGARAGDNELTVYNVAGGATTVSFALVESAP